MTYFTQVTMGVTKVPSYMELGSSNSLIGKFITAWGRNNPLEIHGVGFVASYQTEMLPWMDLYPVTPE